MAIVRRGQSQRRTRLLPLPATDDRIEETCLGIGRGREMPGSNSGFEVGLVLGVTPIAPSGAWLKRLSSKTALVKNRSRQKPLSSKPLSSKTALVKNKGGPTEVSLGRA